MLGQLGKREARALLRQNRVGRLGCCDNGKPYVVPVNYYFAGNFIYVHSLSGHKIDLLHANPQACLQVDAVEDDFHWQSVIAFGHYEEITGEAMRKRSLSRLLSWQPHMTPVESRWEGDLSKVIVFRLRVQEITGMYERW